jgi:AraC-like DNA-binding protein
MGIRPEPGILVDHVGKLCNDTFCVGFHRHDLWEVVYYTNGSGRVAIGEETVPFKTGDVFVIPPDLGHSDFSETGFQDVFFTFRQFELPGTSYYRVNDTQEGVLLHLLLHLHDTFQRKPHNWVNVVNAAFRLFEQSFLSLLGTSREDPFVERILGQIAANLCDPGFRLDEAIAELHLNPSYFRERFRIEVGLTPLQLLTKKRIEHAQQLLLSQGLTGYPIKEIARMSGFYDPYFFSRTFRKWTGVPPSRWKAY